MGHTPRLMPSTAVLPLCLYEKSSSASQEIHRIPQIKLAIVKSVILLFVVIKLQTLANMKLWIHIFSRKKVYYIVKILHLKKSTPGH